MLPVTRNVMAGTRSSLMMVARRQQHTITPTALAGIESRWTKLPECEQGAISDYLAERQKGDWKNLTLEEKRAAYWIAYGSYGARTPPNPAMRWKVAGWSTAFVVLAGGLTFAWFAETKPELRTDTEEWKRAVHQRAIENKQNPYSGAYAEYRKAHGDK